LQKIYNIIKRTSLYCQCKKLPRNYINLYFAFSINFAQGAQNNIKLFTVVFANKYRFGSVLRISFKLQGQFEILSCMCISCELARSLFFYASDHFRLKNLSVLFFPSPGATPLCINSKLIIKIELITCTRSTCHLKIRLSCSFPNFFAANNFLLAALSAHPRDLQILYNNYT